MTASLLNHVTEGSFFSKQCLNHPVLTWIKEPWTTFSWKKKKTNFFSSFRSFFLILDDSELSDISDWRDKNGPNGESKNCT